MQQTVLRKGELAIREREEEIRMLDLQVVAVTDVTDVPMCN